MVATGGRASPASDPAGAPGSDVGFVGEAGFEGSSGMSRSCGASLLLYRATLSAMGKAPEPGEGAGRSRIFIGAGGEVVVENLTPALLEVAPALNPDDRRLRAIASTVAPDSMPPAPAPPAPAPSAPRPPAPAPFGPAPSTSAPTAPPPGLPKDPPP